MGLPEEEGELQGADVADEFGHGIDATVAEEEGVAAAVGVFRLVAQHGLVGIGHGDVLVGEGPAGGLDTGLCSVGGGVGVEVVSVGQVSNSDATGYDLSIGKRVAAGSGGPPSYRQVHVSRRRRCVFYYRTARIAAVIVRDDLVSIAVI